MSSVDKILDDIFKETRTIAVIGASPKPERPSHYVGAYLRARGYKIIGVNPGHPGRMMFGEPVVAHLSDIQHTVDMIDIFRRSDHVLSVVEDAIEALPGLQTVWMQLGIFNAEAADLAEAQGMRVIQDRCPKIEFPRLYGEKTLPEIKG
ncbi:hypothetical protein SAMN04488118_105189 [Epibacterium ulvae]|uniref:CoA-binding domain-containing protein n=1 Tax=Epibacterium ulvae TaxID=1156985 RepID=A0A1G5QRF6_9RHOB|nr:CoA-binding protein [Epibacterium ulvae]SCZ64110.1 hypothetical protein SAMN04488118_105189 [Epibacterium ulvae]